jgi:hypothetical protein
MTLGVSGATLTGAIAVLVRGRLGSERGP